MKTKMYIKNKLVGAGTGFVSERPFQGNKIALKITGINTKVSESILIPHVSDVTFCIA